MNKTEFVKAVAEKAEISQAKAKEVVDAFIEVVKEQMTKGETIAMPGFGSFSVVEKPARPGVNPRTKEKITIAARKVVKFKPGKGIMD